MKLSAISQAVADENEACAKLVEQLGEGVNVNLKVFAGFIARRLRDRIPQCWHDNEVEKCQPQ